MFLANKISPASIILLLSISTVLFLTAYKFTKPPTPPDELQGVLRPSYKPLLPIKLTGRDGALFDEKIFSDKWSVVFFGYLSCPDICPNTLIVLKNVQHHLKQEIADAEVDLQVVFVSVDPKRDSISEIGEYVNYFNSEFIGVTGSKEEIDKLTHQFGAGYIIEDETGPGIYNVAHTSALFLVDPQSRLVASFSQPHYAETITTQYVKIVKYIGNG